MMTKKEIRKIYKKKRQELSPDERVNLSNQILESLHSFINLEGKVVSVFLPIERFKEIVTVPILSLENTKCVLPVVLEDGKLEHILYESQEQIKISDWGIPEPIFGEKLDVALIDVVLVPLLAIDKRGYRVGYGAGFYDRFLSQCKKDCVFIGLSFHEPIDEISDLNKFDIALHSCISPNNIYHF